VPRTFRIFLSISLPLITLVLGWQLGISFEQRQLADEAARLEEMSTGGVGSGETLTDPEQEVNISLLWSVWRMLLRHYIAPDELNSTELLYGAVEGLVRAAGDPYTLFMTPSQNKDFRQSLEGKLQGIGAELAFREGAIVVVAPLKGSPAQRAGLLPEDMITQVDGVDIEGESLNDVVQRIRGKKGTTVALTILREGEFNPRTLSIVRDDINIPSVESKLIETGSGSLGYVALNQFGDTSTAEFRAALETFTDKPVKGIIVDLRFNGGGYLEGAVEITSLFLEKGKIVSVERRGTVTR